MFSIEPIAIVASISPLWTSGVARLSPSMRTVVVSPNPPPNSSVKTSNVWTKGLSLGIKSVVLKTVSIFVKAK